MRWAFGSSLKHSQTEICDYIYKNYATTNEEKQNYHYNGLTESCYAGNLLMVMYMINVLEAENYTEGLEQVCYGIRKGGHMPIGSFDPIDWDTDEMNERVKIAQIMLRRGAKAEEALPYFRVTDRSSPIHRMLLSQCDQNTIAFEFVISNAYSSLWNPYEKKN